MEEDEVVEEAEENVYKEETRESLVDNDELSPEEEAFMKGYDEASEGDDVFEEALNEKEEEDQ